jgi:predicted O-methyltransferase YrrM
LCTHSALLVVVLRSRDRERIPCGMSQDSGFFGGSTIHVDGVDFVSEYGGSTAERFCILKTTEQLEFYVQLCKRFEGGAVVELGIAAGGSAALLALLAHPRKLVALELDPTPVAGLRELIERRGLGESVRPIYGVDQADGERLIEIVRDEFAGAPLDLVIDDASHLLAETTSSFETLFPALRPGGIYMIEDWNSAHLIADQLGQRTTERDGLPMPLSPLLMELLLVRASSGDVIREIQIGNLWATIERGSAALDTRTFRVKDHYTDYFGLLDSVKNR